MENMTAPAVKLNVVDWVLRLEEQCADVIGEGFKGVWRVIFLERGFFEVFDGFKEQFCGKVLDNAAELSFGYRGVLWVFIKQRS